MTNQTKAFNTGRKYAAYGQVIAYEILGDDGEFCRVAYDDITRGLSGVVRIWRDSADVTNAHVLAAYDASSHDGIGMYSHPLLMRRLSEAGHAILPV